MLIVTGGIACGKSTFLKVARCLMLDCMDADEWYHDVFKPSDEFLKLTNDLFGTQNLFDVAFTHQNWNKFEEQTVYWFNVCLNWRDKLPNILVLPEYIKHRDSFAWLKSSVLTIERKDNLKYANQRDTRRPEILTKLIHANQSTPEQRLAKSNYVLYNTGTKEQFEKECVQWLNVHLQEVLIRHTKVTSM